MEVVGKDRHFGEFRALCEKLNDRGFDKVVHEQGVHHNIRDRLDRTIVCRCLGQRFGSGKRIDDFESDLVGRES